MKRLFLTVLMVLGAGNLAVVLATPSPSIQWASDAGDSVIVVSSLPEEATVQRCVGEGFTFEVRFELQLCKRKRFWMNRCGETKVFIRQMSREPVSDRLSLKEDTLGDGEDPEERLLDDGGVESLTRLSSLAPVKLRGLWRDDNFSSADKLSVRVLQSCRGAYSPIVRRLSQVLSLGVVDIRGEDSGWIGFPLNQEKASER